MVISDTSTASDYHLSTGMTDTDNQQVVLLEHDY